MTKQTLRFFTIALAGLISLVSAEFTLATASEAKTPLPRLIGTWEGDYPEPVAGGRLAQHERLEVTRQEGPLLWADDVWFPIDPQTGKLSAEPRRDPLLGSLNAAGTGGMLVKQGARFAFKVLDQDRLEMEFVSIRSIGGFSPSAFYTILVRNGAGKVTGGEKQPRLAGSWRGRYRYPVRTGGVQSVFQLDVVQQDGALLWVDDVWTTADPATGKDRPEQLHRDRMLGSLSPDGTRGVLAKESAVYAFKILGRNRMEAEFTRLGGTVEEITTFYSILQRGRIQPVAGSKRTPDLRGNWEGDCRYAQPDGVKSTRFRIEVTRQDGLLIWADNVWHPLDPATGQPGEQTRREPLIGSLHPGGREGVLAKPGARFALTILDRDRIRVEFVRMDAGGQLPMAFYSTLYRVK